METNIIGLKNGCFAKLIDDKVYPPIYETPVEIPGLKITSYTPTVVGYNNSSDNLTTIDEEVVTGGALAITFQDIIDEHLAYLRGKQIDTETGSVVTNVGDNAPYFAFGYKLTGNNGLAKYVWLYKGKFGEFTGMNGQTIQAGTVTPQDVTTTYKVTPTANGDIYSSIRNDSSYYDDEIGATWFDSVKLAGEVREDVILTSAGAVTGVSVNNSAILLGNSILTANVEATVIPTNATNQNVTWSSSDLAVATVVGTGLNAVITSVATGNSTITVTTIDGSFTADIAVTVI